MYASCLSSLGTGPRGQAKPKVFGRLTRKGNVRKLHRRDSPIKVRALPVYERPVARAGRSLFALMGHTEQMRRVCLVNSSEPDNGRKYS